MVCHALTRVHRVSSPFPGHPSYRYSSTTLGPIGNSRLQVVTVPRQSIQSLGRHHCSLIFHGSGEPPSGELHGPAVSEYPPGISNCSGNDEHHETDHQLPDTSAFETGLSNPNGFTVELNYTCTPSKTISPCFETQKRQLLLHNEVLDRIRGTVEALVTQPLHTRSKLCLPANTIVVNVGTHGYVKPMACIKHSTSDHHISAPDKSRVDRACLQVLRPREQHRLRLKELT